MPADFVSMRVTGADQLAEVGARLKETGDKGLRKDLLRGINRSLKPAKAKVKEAARRDLPHEGGLNEYVANAKIGSRTRTTGRNPAVFLTGKKSGHDLRAIDRGKVRTPWGRKGPNAWQTQNVKPGWWSQTLAGEVPAIQREVLKTLDDVARRLTDG